LLIVHVEAFVAAREERGDRSSLASPGREDDARPGDLERAVLDIHLGQRLVLARVPRDVELRLIEQRSHRLSVDDPHLSGMLLHELDRADRIRFGCPEQLAEAAKQDVRSPKRIRGANESEEVVTFTELLQCERDPLDVRRRGGRVLGRSQEGNLGSIPARNLGDLLAVRRTDDTLEDPGLPGRADRIRDQRVTGEWTDVFVRYALRAGAR